MLCRPELHDIYTTKLSMIHCIALMKEPNEYPAMLMDMNLVNINTIENFTNETILSKAHASLVRIKTLNKSSIAIAFLDVIQQINIIYCRHIYHKVNGGVKRYFDMNVFRDKSERGAQTEMARMKRGVCRYIKLVREFGVNIIYLPQIFNPYNLREVSNKEYSMKIFVSNFYFLYLFR